MLQFAITFKKPHFLSILVPFPKKNSYIKNQKKFHSSIFHKTCKSFWVYFGLFKLGPKTSKEDFPQKDQFSQF